MYVIVVGNTHTHTHKNDLKQQSVMCVCDRSRKVFIGNTHTHSKKKNGFLGSTFQKNSKIQKFRYSSVKDQGFSVHIHINTSSNKKRLFIIKGCIHYYQLTQYKSFTRKKNLHNVRSKDDDGFVRGGGEISSFFQC